MKLTRRELIILSTFSVCGLGIFGKFWLDQSSANKGTLSTITPLSDLPQTSPIFRFIASGDMGSGNKNQYAVAEAMVRYYEKNPFALAIWVGDNIYNNGEISKIREVFELPYAELLKNKVKFYACLGNHDIRTDNGWPQVKYTQFNMPDRYYTWRRDIVQFFALDTNNNADWDKQLTWLEKELAKSDAVWKIVFGHHQIFSAGVYGMNEPFIKVLTPIFQKYQVQLYINGHEHDYERTKSIKGTTYLICGNGGASLRPVGRSPVTDFAASVYGFTAIDVYADRLTIRAIDTNNQIFDQADIYQTAKSA